MPTHTLGREYDLIDVGRADCHVHDQDHRQGRVRKVSGTSGKYAGQTKKSAGQAEKYAGQTKKYAGEPEKSSGERSPPIGYADAFGIRVLSYHLHQPSTTKKNHRETEHQPERNRDSDPQDHLACTRRGVYGHDDLTPPMSPSRRAADATQRHPGAARPSWWWCHGRRETASTGIRAIRRHSPPGGHQANRRQNPPHRPLRISRRWSRPAPHPWSWRGP